MSRRFHPSSTSELPGGSRWRPAPALGASMALHLLAIPALLAAPAAWPLWAGLLAADHVALGLLGLSPGAAWIGASVTRLPAPAAARNEVALTFDDGPDPEVTPRILDLLDRAGARASFFCIGRRAARYPALVADIVARGHSVENHSYHHAAGFALRPPWVIRRDLLQAQTVLTALVGRAPRFVRAPFGIRGPMLDPALAGTGLTHVAWTRRGRDTVTGDPARIHATLTRDLAGGDILLLHDSGAAPGPDGASVVLSVLPALLADLRAAGLRSVGLPEAMPRRLTFPHPPAHVSATLREPMR